MNVRRLRRGEWIVLAALIALAVSLTLDWFTLPGLGGADTVYVLRGYGAADVSGPPTLEDGRGWTGLGFPWFVLVLLAGLALLTTLVQAARAGTGRPTYGALATVVVALPLTALIAVATILRTLLVTPSFEVVGTGRHAPLDAGQVAVGAWIGLAGLLLGTVGLWVALADDRTTARDAVAPPAPREVPPARPAPS